MPRRAAKKDTNHSEVVSHVRCGGFHVTELYQLGDGVPDILVTGYHRYHGHTMALLVELKVGKAPLTPDEWEFYRTYPADGPLIVASSAEEIFRWFGAI